VPQMERDRWQTQRLRVEFTIGQAGSPLGNVVERKIKSMQNRAPSGRHFRVRSAQPWFDVGG